MADVKATITTATKSGFDAAEIKKYWANKDVFVPFMPKTKAQASKVWEVMRGMVGEKPLLLKAQAAKFNLNGLPDNNGAKPVEHKMTVLVNGTRACMCTLNIAQSTSKVVQDVGFSGVSSSEDAWKLLQKLKSGNPEFKNLVLKDGDSEHPDNKLWQFKGKRNSLPMNAHSKGKGGKNEKVAIAELKKTMKNAGFV